jgi:hypothetical protein
LVDAVVEHPKTVLLKRFYTDPDCTTRVEAGPAEEWIG